MKTTPAILLFGLLSVSLLADDAAKKPAAAEKTAPDAPISVTAAKVTGAFVLKDGAISQSSQTEVEGGGKAVFTVTVPKDGEYVVKAVVDAPSEDANSFFLNFDKQPEDPLMIWDIEVTKGFEERVVSWRGNGDSSTDEFTPKVFKLTAGEHTLIVIGREPCSLKSIALKPAK